MADDAILSEDSTGDGMRIQKGSPGSHNVDADNYGAYGEQMIISDDPMHQFASALSDRVRVSRSRATAERNQSEDNGSARYNGRQFTRLTANVSMDNANIFYRFCNPELQEIVLR
ncbi:hypothetical protein MP228_004335 [Amoeboaphelidium protococcarum]|nr:hypothetical protein MP228_004335 [Amoeboaphelidium protococcarum]